MKQLIVNADDFGADEPTNLGVIEAHERGIVRSASLLGNGDGFEHAVLLARSHPSLDIGVHLNALRGRALSQPSVLARAGRILVGSPSAFLWHYLFRNRAMLREIEAEFAAQIERVRAAGITPSHLDTEKHLHVLPGIAAIVLNLAKRYGIPAVRFPFEDGRAIIRVAPMQRLKAGVSGVLFKRRVERLFCESGMARTDHFRGISLSGRFTPQNLTEVLASLPNGTTELSCHPGRPGSTYASYIAPHRAAELETLTDLSVADALAAHDITLTSFHELYGNR